MKYMKKITTLILTLFIGFSALGQQTYFTSSPSGSTSLTGLQYRYKAITPDSLNQLFMFWNGKYNQVYTATEANLRFAPITGGGYVPNSRLISTNAGTGLFGGGNLGSNVSLYNDTTLLQTRLRTAWLYAPINNTALTGITTARQLQVSPTGTTPDAMGYIGVTLPYSAATKAYFGMTSFGRVKWATGIRESNNALVIGSGPNVGAGATIDTVNLELSYEGNLALRGWIKGQHPVGNALTDSGTVITADGKLAAVAPGTFELTANKATDFSTLNNTKYPTTQAVANYVTNKADTSIYSNVKRRLGQVVSTNFVASSSSQYTTVNPNMTVSWQNGYVQLSGAPNNQNNYIYFTNYVNGSMVWTQEIEFVPTVAGNSLRIGQYGENNMTSAGLIMSGGSIGKLTINTATNTRATSDSALVYSLADTLVLRFSENITQYTVQAWKKSAPQNVVTLTWVNDKVFGTNFSNTRASRPAIFTYGGTQRITKHKLFVQDIVQSDLVILANSIGAGSYAGSQGNMHTVRLKNAINGDVAIISASSQRTSDYLILKPQIFSLNPRFLLMELGINDIANAVPLTTIKSNITTMITDCINNNVIPIVGTVLPVAAGYTSGSLTNQQIRDTISALNTWILNQKVQTINTYSALQLGGFLNSAYNSGDDLHPNALGHMVIAATEENYFTNVLPLKQDQFYVDDIAVVNTTNNNLGTSAAMSIRFQSGTTLGNLTAYGDNNSGTSRAGKVALLNNGGTLVLQSNGTSPGIDKVIAGSNFSTNLVSRETADSAAFFQPSGISLRLDQNAATNIRLYNNNSGSSAQSNILIHSNTVRVGVQAASSGRTAVNGTSRGRFLTFVGNGSTYGGVGDINLLAGGTDEIANLILKASVDSIQNSVQIRNSISSGSIFRNNVRNTNSGASAGAQWGAFSNSASVVFGAYSSNQTLGKANSSTLFATAGTGGLWIGAASVADAIKFTFNSNDFNGGEKMRLLNAGDLLINRTTTSGATGAKLHVSAYIWSKHSVGTPLTDSVALIKLDGTLAMAAPNAFLTPAQGNAAYAPISANGTVTNVTSANTDIGIATGISTPVLTWNRAMSPTVTGSWEFTGNTGLFVNANTTGTAPFRALNTNASGAAAVIGGGDATHAVIDIRSAAGTGAALIYGNGSAVFNAPIKAGGYTVSTLPSGTIGQMTYVTDALAPSYLVTVVGGGAIVAPVFYNGTNWVSH